RHPRFDEIARESLRNIVEQCESLKRIAQNFASFAAFPQSRKERRAFGRLVADAVRLYAPERPDGPRVVVSLDVPRDVHVLADEDELRRVFLNLFNNAFEAMGPTGTLSVAASVRGEEPDLVAQVRICDTGRGIPEEHRERLFEPYFSTRTGGTGLGLAICRKIMHGHRGDVAFEPAPGGGACFVLTLPCFRTAGAGEASFDPFGDTRTVHRG
ncbi:MAG TPA: HAMP domain-containing sensor histidine kinase, partial [Planctomycetota bacterium]|nr:HAMP domain-containing sensor histidine kinase [Planctomycetota bacterium]